MKNPLEEFNSRFEEAKRISTPEDKSMEITQSVEQKEKKDERK